MTDNDNKEKKIPDIDVKDGSASKLVDGITDTINGVLKTGVEIARAPLTVAGRTVDGAMQGTRQGIDQGNKLPEKISKGSMGTVGGTVQGTIKGAQAAMGRIGEAISDVGHGISKLGESFTDGANEVGDLTKIKRKNKD